MIPAPKFKLRDKAWIVLGRRAIEVTVMGVESSERLRCNTDYPLLKHIRDATEHRMLTYRVAYLRQGECCHVMTDVGPNDIFATKEELIKSL